MENKGIKFKYVFEEDYEPEYANGAFGGVLPTGEIVINFFVDRYPIPYEEEFKLNEDGSLGAESKTLKPEEFKVRRSVKCGVIITKDTAGEVCKWLKSQLEELGVDDDAL